MRVEWLDAALTKAVVTRGCWRKKRARVEMVKDRSREYLANDWKYTDTGIPCEHSLEKWLDLQQRRERGCRCWVPVDEFPTARVVDQ